MCAAPAELAQVESHAPEPRTTIVEENAGSRIRRASRRAQACWWKKDADAWDVLEWPAELATAGLPNRQSSHALWAMRLPHAAANVASVLVHRRISRARYGGDHAYAGVAITDGEAEFTYTLLSGSGSGVKVGVAALDGSRSWGIKLSNGEMSTVPPPADVDGPTEGLAPAGARSARAVSRKPPPEFLEAFNEGGGRPLVHYSITVKVAITISHHYKPSL